MNNSKIFLVLFSSVFIDLVGFGMVIPLLPFYAEHFGAGPQVVTLVVATYSLMQFIFTPLWGNLSDRFGRRPIILASIAGSGISYILFAFANSLGMLFAARALSGTMGSTVAVALAYMADITTPENRARGMGIIGAAIGGSFTLGPAIGGILAGSDPDNLNFQLPFFAATSLSLIAFVFAVFALPESRSHPAVVPQNQQKSKKGISASIAIWKDSRVLLFVSILFLVGAAFSGIESVFTLWTERELGWGPEQNGYLFMFVGIIGFVIQGGLIGTLTKRFGESRLMILGLISLGMGLLLIPFFSSMPLLLVGWMLIGIGAATYRPTLNSLLSQSTPPEQQGTILGAAQSAFTFSRILGPVWAGFIFSVLGRDWPFFSGAILLLIAVAIGRVVIKKLAVGKQ